MENISRQIKRMQVSYEFLATVLVAVNQPYVTSLPYDVGIVSIKDNARKRQLEIVLGSRFFQELAEGEEIPLMPLHFIKLTPKLKRKLAK